jgi:hypothetical protein
MVVISVLYSLRISCSHYSLFGDNNHFVLMNSFLYILLFNMIAYFSIIFSVLLIWYDKLWAFLDISKLIHLPLSLFIHDFLSINYLCKLSHILFLFYRADPKIHLDYQQINIWLYLYPSLLSLSIISPTWLFNLLLLNISIFICLIIFYF